MATRIKYSPTRVKSRNFLSNISYTGISKGDLSNENFILDVYILLVKNLNPFSLQRKTSDKLKHDMVYMLRRECIPPQFYRYICQDENFKYLNGRDVASLLCSKSLEHLLIRTKVICACFKRTSLTTKTYFNMSIRMCSCCCSTYVYPSVTISMSLLTYASFMVQFFLIPLLP